MISILENLQKEKLADRYNLKNTGMKGPLHDDPSIKMSQKGEDQSAEFKAAGVPDPKKKGGKNTKETGKTINL